MAKKRARSSSKSQESSPQLLARQFLPQMESTVDGTADGSVIGFKIPLPLQFLIDCEVFPFGIHMNFNAKKMSCKSMLVFEFGRLVKPYYGKLEYIVTEAKWSESLAYSVIGWSYEDRKTIRPKTVGTLNEMEDEVLSVVNKHEQLATKGHNKSGPLGWHWPVVVAMDSLSGANLAERNEAIEREGYAKQDYARSAMSLTDYFKMISNKIRTYPIVLLTVNHRKEDPGPTQYSAPSVRQPGGKHMGFQATYDIALASMAYERRFDESKHGSLQRESNVIKLTCEKNSLGQKNRNVEVRVTWQDKLIADPATGRLRTFRVSKWHWDEATVDLIEKWLMNKVGYGDQGGGAKRSVAGRNAKFAQFFDFNRVNKKGMKYWSATLGMTEDDAVTKSQFGRLIEENQDAREAIARAFGVGMGVEWDNSVEFSKFRADYLKAADAREKEFFSGNDIDKYMFDESELDPEDLWDDASDG